jgi:phosphatidylglycerol:prolipoprotein diacylglycerol transferase
MYPKLIEVGPVTIHTYGVLLATAILVSISVMAYLAESDGISRRRSWDLGFVIIISSLIGAKLLLVITSHDYYLANPSRLFSLEFLQAGGVYYGGLIGALIGSLIFARMHPSVSYLRLADATGPAIPLGQSIGRLGCFAAGCDYGTSCDLPWAVTFTSEYAHQLVGVPINVPIHPYQLYESATTFLLFLALLWVYQHRSFLGQVVCSYFIIYGILRFFLEFFRGDADRGYLFGGLLSTSQFISIVVVPIAIFAYLYLRSRPVKDRV